MPEALHVAERSAREVRCPYCHDALGPAARLERCAGCEVVLHRECWRAHGRCPTTGCPESIPAAREPEREPARPARPDGPAPALDVRVGTLVAAPAAVANGHAGMGAIGGVAAAIAAALVWKYVAPDTRDWVWVLAVCVPYFAALGAFTGWAIDTFRIRGDLPGGGDIALKVVVVAVCAGLFASCPPMVAVALSPAVVALTVLLFFKLLGR